MSLKLTIECPVMVGNNRWPEPGWARPSERMLSHEAYETVKAAARAAMDEFRPIETTDGVLAWAALAYCRENNLGVSLRLVPDPDETYIVERSV